MPLNTGGRAPIVRHGRRRSRKRLVSYGLIAFWGAVAWLLLAGWVGLAHCRVAVGSLAERLGYKPTDRLLIIHADDAGMCHSVNEATIRALESGGITSASVMVPCPAFPEMARYCRQHPEADIGVHLTLTSEWQHYRWAPLTPADEAPGLRDDQGYLPHTVLQLVRQAKTEEVRGEIRRQIERARAAGMHPTHVDTHMGALFPWKFCGAYTGVAREEGVLPMLFAPITPGRFVDATIMGFNPVATTDTLLRQGFVMLDNLDQGEGGSTLEARRASYYKFLRELPPGVTQVIVHLSLDTPEIREITPSWRERWNEYQIFTDPRTKDLIRSLGIHLIHYRDLRKVMDW